VEWRKRDFSKLPHYDTSFQLVAALDAFVAAYPETTEGMVALTRSEPSALPDVLVRRPPTSWERGDYDTTCGCVLDTGTESYSLTYQDCPSHQPEFIRAFCAPKEARDSESSA
jgi:hypothetical protein